MGWKFFMLFIQYIFWTYIFRFLETWPNEPLDIVRIYIYTCPAVLYLHWPSCVLQPISSEATPGLEQLHISHPTRGWQPNVWGSQVTQSGCRVRGGQMHSPVTGSHRRVPQLHAREKSKQYQTPINPWFHHVVGRGVVVHVFVPKFSGRVFQIGTRVFTCLVFSSCCTETIPNRSVGE